MILLLFLLFLSQFPKTALAISSRYNNPFQGLFQCHSTEAIGADFVKGGGLAVTWGFLQKDSPDRLHQANLATFISALRSLQSQGKKAYLHLMVYAHQAEADLPLYGRPVFPDWLNVAYSNSSDDNTDNKIKGLDGGGPSLYPSPWDQEYRDKLEKFLILFNQALHDYQVADVIEYIEPSVGGRWAAPELWINQSTLEAWRQAAGCDPNDWNCLGRRFTQAVNDITDIYMRTLPDYPFMFVGGACRSPDSSQSCNYTGFPSLKEKYGMRVFYKKAGLGHINDNSCGLNSGEFSQFCGGTRCGQETWGSSLACTGNRGQGFQTQSENSAILCNVNNYQSLGYWGVYEKIFDDSLKREGLSYYCLYGNELSCSREPRVSQVNQTVANRLGAQISLISHTLSSSSFAPGTSVSFNLTWRNQGSTFLVAPKKEGLKWIPSSYRLFLEFVQSGQVVHYQEFDLDPPTTTWHPLATNTPKSLNSVEKTTPVTFTIPSFFGGSYQLYVGLVAPDNRSLRFALTNSDSQNDLTSRRYLLSSDFSVVGSAPHSCQCPSSLSSSSPPKSAGNANCDNTVDMLDFSLWLGEYLRSDLSSFTADFNCDHHADLLDFSVWLRRFVSP